MLDSFEVPDGRLRNGDDCTARLDAGAPRCNIRMITRFLLSDGQNVVQYLCQLTSGENVVSFSTRARYCEWFNPQKFKYNGPPQDATLTVYVFERHWLFASFDIIDEIVIKLRKDAIATQRLTVINNRSEDAASTRMSLSYEIHYEKVMCNMEEISGGWTIIQRRSTGELSFERNWTEYQSFFGTKNMSEYWLGLDAMNALTSQEPMALRVDLHNCEGKKFYQLYCRLQVGNLSTNYALRVSNVSHGNAMDSLNYRIAQQSKLNGIPFSTPDKDNDRSANRNWAALTSSGFWFNNGAVANLNGMYNSSCSNHLTGYGTNGITWFTAEASLKRGFRSTKVSILLKSFENPSGKLQDGHFCHTHWWGQPAPCDIHMKISFKPKRRYSEVVPVHRDLGQLTRGNNKVTFLPGHRYGQWQNPEIFVYDGPWNGFRLTVEVYDISWFKKAYLPIYTIHLAVDSRFPKDNIFITRMRKRGAGDIL
ncbi:unnamed protein product [Soboliphyme baturini]|uniref:Fibrinogen C-terminal domain-containing protein n=1 Tax=Soboliphyme baturini TaxID=241478 RepID=A0A183IWL1_9BILA|nr:unnamed protein product [Soboliphyme baturini]